MSRTWRKRARRSESTALAKYYDGSNSDSETHTLGRFTSAVTTSSKARANGTEQEL